MLDMKIFQKNRFYLNKANYGDDYASYPIAIKVKSNKKLKAQNKNFSLTAQSGIQLINNLEFLFYDHFNQIVVLNYAE